MDFVVVGFGLGAFGVLLGVVLLGWLAGQTERRAAAAPTPDAAAYERASAAECRGAGQAFLYAGAAIILATVGGLAGALDDQVGAFLVATTATVGALGILLWGYLYRSRHPMPPRPRRQPEPIAMSAGTVPVPATRAVSASSAAAMATDDAAPEGTAPATDAIAETAELPDAAATVPSPPETDHAGGPIGGSASESNGAPASDLDPEAAPVDRPAAPAQHAEEPSPKTTVDSRP